MPTRALAKTPPTNEQLVAWFEAGEFLAQVDSYFGLDGSEAFRAVARQAAALDRAGRLDLLSLIESGAVAALGAHDFFTVQHFMVEALPDLDAPVPRMLAAVESLVKQGGDDLASTRPNGTLRDWLKKDLTRAEAVIAEARAGDDTATSNLTFALEALADPARARDFLGDIDPRHKASGITALSRMADADPASRARSLSELATALGDGDDDMLCANGLEAALAISGQGEPPAPDAMMDVLNLALKARGDGALNRAAHALWAYPAALGEAPAAALLNALVDLNPEHKGTIDELDLGLKTLIDRGQAPAVLDFLATLLVKDRGRLKARAFDSTWRAIVAGPADVLSRWVVTWLISGESALGLAVSEVLSHLERDEAGLPLDRSALPTSAADLGYLARKATGWFMLQPHLATTILLAVLGVCDSKTASPTAGFLVNPILRNYPAMEDILSAVPADDPARLWVDAALREHQRYLDALKAAPDIPELRPSEHNRRIHHLHQADQMRAMHKAAEAQSVFFNLVHRSVMLYGARSLTYVEDFGGSGPRRPMEMELGTHEVSMIMPRLEMLDPIGLQLMLVQLRGEARPQ